MQKIPKYKALRIYFVAFLLYYLLISPVSSMLFVTNYPKFHEKIDLLKTDNDTLKNTININLSNQKDSINTTNSKDTLTSDYKKIITAPHETKLKRKRFMELESFFFELLSFAFALGFLFALPFKIYFKRKRKNKKIPAKLVRFCKKTMIYSPLINAGIVSIPFIITAVYMMNQLFISDIFENSLKRNVYTQYWIVFIFAGILTTMFVYYWHRHLMQTRYLEHVFSKEELRKRIYPGKGGKIKYKLLISSTMTTLLPLSIVLVYLYLSLSSLKDLNLKSFTQPEMQIIFGRYYHHFEADALKSFLESMNLYYITAPDTIFMFAGIIVGIIISLVYLIFFVYWSNYAIIIPVGELLKNMQNTTGGKLDNYSIVRTNDEIGELAENYNVMTEKLGAYISRIAKMNEELEEKVKQRTKKIEAQKQKIEMQKAEVEAQRDEIEQQRDYVIKQRDIVAHHKRAITDSIEYAGNIQRALLPPEELFNRYLKEYFILYKPKDIVSGDFYWLYKKKDNDKKLLIAAADCTGHGVPGAFLSMLGISYLNEIVIDKDEFNPATILNQLRDKIIKSLHQTGEAGKSKDGIDIALCSIDFENLIIEFSGAYNPLYIIRENIDDNLLHEYKDKADYIISNYGNSILIEIKADKIPIGISPKKMNTFSSKRFRLKKGDEIFLFSDGYVDQFGGSKRLKFLYKRFRESLAKMYGITMKEKQKKLEAIHSKWKGKEKQIDDILIIGIRI
ncbi:MAG: SpoIIE family protein phosphatase [Bacteroidales bacterium]|nr:SpoIIE family protein phosphatase [Bacteroidales bacterium]